MVPCVRVRRHTATRSAGRSRSRSGRGVGANILEAPHGLVDVAGRELVEFLVVAENDDSDVDGAENAELVCLFEQAAFALQEGTDTKSR